MKEEDWQETKERGGRLVRRAQIQYWYYPWSMGVKILKIRPHMPFLGRKNPYWFTSGKLEGRVASAGRRVGDMEEEGMPEARPSRPFPPPPASAFHFVSQRSLGDRFMLPHPQVPWVWVGLEVSEEKSEPAEWRSAWLLLLAEASRAYWEVSC